VILGRLAATIALELDPSYGTSAEDGAEMQVRTALDLAVVGFRSCTLFKENLG